MPSDYSKSYTLEKKVGNNLFSYDTRTNTTLHIPALQKGSLEDVQIGTRTVFADMEDGALRECVGLEHFIQFRHCEERPVLRSKLLAKGEGNPADNNISFILGSPRHSTNVSVLTMTEPRGHESLLPTFQHSNTPITIFDNHNHALYFWLEAVRTGIITPGFQLIHIDEHSDLWSNPYTLDLEKAIQDPTYAWEFTNYSCNVGNYIQPGIESGLLGGMIRIENESQLDLYRDYAPPANAILNLDLDIFSPELDFIPESKKLWVIQNLIRKVKYVTIATSPFFIDQGLALKKLFQIFERKDV